MRRTRVTIPLNGDVSFEHSGYNGDGCKEASDRIIKALGGTVIDRHETPDMHNSTEEETHQEKI